MRSMSLCARRCYNLPLICVGGQGASNTNDKDKAQRSAQGTVILSVITARISEIINWDPAHKMHICDKQNSRKIKFLFVAV